MKARSRQAGFTLVEVAIVAIISSILLITIIVLTASSNDAYLTVREDTDANFSLRQALNRISDDLRQSSSSIIHITSDPDNNHDIVDLQVPISQDGSTVNWGAEGTIGWHIHIQVEDGWLIRRVTDGVGIPQRMDEVLARDVDNLFDGQKGFGVTEAAGLYTITLRVIAERKQLVWRRTETTSVSTRN
ncbi:MAG TPA: prepilin-type N-terminal cleavage/methylation domain-containing protein [Planctomycetota bacterium]|nr:prepilin-type N-terminal cleavage/methylation domain-containing protein [Planctomycetota bacterium]